jgi:hypothetical protein
MRAFLAVVAGVGLVVSAIGLLASLPAESLALAAASFGGIVLSGILWMLTEISGQLAIQRASAESPLATIVEGAVARKSKTPEELAAAGDLRLRRFAMIALCVIVLALCAGIVHFR